jgi:hypothetical protein
MRSTHTGVVRALGVHDDDALGEFEGSKADTGRHARRPDEFEDAGLGLDERIPLRTRMAVRRAV